jgi:hypothetical protein
VALPAPAPKVVTALVAALALLVRRLGEGGDL